MKNSSYKNKCLVTQRCSVLDGNQVQACALVISTARHYCLFLVLAVLGYGVARERPFYCKQELKNGLFATFLR